VLSFHEEVGCFALREQGGFIVAMRTGIWLTDKHGLLRRKVCDNPSNPQLARFNDGGTDSLGDSMRARSGGREITTVPC
jgi:sugar lactone lactonase YvrE